MSDVAGKEAFLQHRQEDEQRALLLSLSAGRLVVGQQKDTCDHQGSRLLSNCGLIQPDLPPLYTDDEMRRLHFLKEELRRLEMQRQVRLSLKLLGRQYDFLAAQQARQLVDQTHLVRMALDERVSKISHSGTVMPCQSDDDNVTLNDEQQRFISPAANAANMAMNLLSVHSPRMTEVPSPSLASMVTPLTAGDEESSCDTSVEGSRTKKDASMEDGQGKNRHRHQDGEQQLPYEERESAISDIIPSLIQQYSVRGLEMAPFPLKLHAVLANPRYQHVICWLPDGKSWKVLDAFLLERFVISRYFSHAKYSSFMRQVNGWGFTRRSRRHGPDKGKSYFHVDFVRDDPERCLSMLRRRRVKTKASPKPVLNESIHVVSTSSKKAPQMRGALKAGFCGKA